VRNPRRRRWLLPLAATLLVFGTWQFGQGVYIHAKAMLAQALLRQAWDRTLAGGVHVKPWAWADTWPVARLVVPSLDVDQFVLAGANGRTIAFGPGHVFGTARPGENGNSVIAGHRDTSLAFLAELPVGTELRIERPDGRWVAYRVQSALVLDKRDTWVLSGSPVTELTLITCYPFNALRAGGPQRYVVRAVEVPRAQFSSSSRLMQVSPDSAFSSSVTSIARVRKPAAVRRSPVRG
jgi:sortase A